MGSARQSPFQGRAPSTRRRPDRRAENLARPGFGRRASSVCTLRAASALLVRMSTISRAAKRFPSRYRTTASLASAAPVSGFSPARAVGPLEGPPTASFIGEAPDLRDRTTTLRRRPRGRSAPASSDEYEQGGVEGTEELSDRRSRDARSMSTETRASSSSGPGSSVVSAVALEISRRTCADALRAHERSSDHPHRRTDLKGRG